MIFKYTLIDNITGEIYHFKNKTQFNNFTIEKLTSYGRNKNCYVRLYEITSVSYMIQKKED